MPKFKEGDRVQVLAREAQGKEAQEGRYAPHLANATGSILKIYNQQEIAVELDLDSLPEAIRERHAEQQTRMHERWLNSLSEEARNRLTDDEKTFRLRYVALLNEDDLQPVKAGRAAQPKAEPKPNPVPSQTDAPKAAPRAKQEQAPKTSRKAQPAPESPRRPTPDELEKLEEQYLKARKRRA
ncbi:MAG: hypothetical protein KatS3mg020_0153 [Fimbriimonadales bacterium]|nr:MAG: hypothetical protein KatS3mg020_0153 [Fimbriimonadales bacterium]